MLTPEQAFGYQPSVSVIIPFKSPNEYLRETVRYLCALNYRQFQVILLPDELFHLDQILACADDHSKISYCIVPTGPVGPGKKRDLALPYAAGDILAFLDDDTYPRHDWLGNAVGYFDDPYVAAIGGPAVTPPSDGWAQLASGYVYASFLGGGPYGYRYSPQKARQVDDYPTCNMLVRRSVFERIGGFDTAFWPGEDTKLCLDITRKLGLKILYAPDVLVYHHRRPLLRPHLRQVREYATHRGYFAKRLPATSLRPSYFLPTILVAALLTGASAALALPEQRGWYLALIAAYLMSVITSAATTSRSWKLALPVAAGIVATHLVYGVYCLRGLLVRRLAEESRSTHLIGLEEAG